MINITWDNTYNNLLLNEVGDFYATASTANSAWVRVEAKGYDIRNSMVSEVLFDEELFGVGGEIVLYELQEMIRAFMKANHSIIAQIRITVDNGRYNEFKVVFQDHDNVKSLNDMKKTFLLSSEIKIFYGLPQGEKVYSLGMLSEGSAPIEMHAVAECSDGERFAFILDTPFSFTCDCEIKEIRPDFDALMAKANMIDQSVERLVSLEITQNERHTFWVFDYESSMAPHNAFCFYNNFGVLESLWLKGVTEEKIETDRSVTTFSSNKRVAYDATAERKFSFHTAALTRSQERTFIEFLCSDIFFTYIGGELCEAMTEKSTFERTNNIQDVNSGEFDFLLANKMAFAVIGTKDRIFNDTYNYVYG